ncbi:Type II secretory pathway, pseudopilin PulG [Collimonas sp. OK307]|uniref:type II secretion system protein n=1 Tax=Collimonas sp. OK307 TaxID=1801620 RepID=UPI0008F11D5D|nr:type II secretion system protein [Collimonas sp. OK307]SFI22117.1 Type II secretory pathway, pseudopilin PulG [Collimonas sp. OK307]
MSRRLMHDTQYHAGLAYLSLLILLAIIGVAAAATLQMGSVLQRREAEEELLAIGSEFRSALVSYANATPIGQQAAPRTLSDLLKDPRYPSIRRHLRKLYADPISGKPEWGIVLSIDGKGIVGVYSLSTATPIKIGNFDPAFQNFADKKSYADWVFMATTANLNPLNSSNTQQLARPFIPPTR